jgi:hypothetical protein
VAQIDGVGPSAEATDAADGKHPTLASAEGSDAEDGVEDDMPPAPTLVKQSSSTSLQEAVQQAEAAAPPALVRQTSAELARRFQTMISWEQSDHPIVVFKMDGFSGTVAGLDIMSMNPSYLQQYIDGQLRTAIETNQIELARDWEKITNEQGVEILRGVEGLYDHRGGLQALEDGYVLTGT